MGREQHLPANRHFHFGGMAMVQKPIGRVTAIDSAEARRLLRLAPGTANARSSVDNQDFRLDEPSLDKRFERKDRRGRVAARSSNRLGAANIGSIEFGNSVNEFADQVRGLVRMAVPLLVSPGIIQPEVGTK